MKRIVTTKTYTHTDTEYYQDGSIKKTVTTEDNRQGFGCFSVIVIGFLFWITMNAIVFSVRSILGH